MSLAATRRGHHSVEGLEDLLAAAQQKLAGLAAEADRLSAPRNEYETDMATVSGIRRKPSQRAEAQRHGRYDREAAAWEQVRQAQQSVDALTVSLERARSSQPVPFTEADLKAATHLRDRNGWREIVKVNAKTVSVATGYSWTDRVARAAILEVRTVTQD